MGTTEAAAPVENFILSVEKTGLGSVMSTPSGIDCGMTCSASFADGTEVTLSDSADTGSIFTGWGGDCSSDGMVTMSADRSCTANFVIAEPGSISGTVRDATTLESISDATVKAFLSGNEAGTIMTDTSGDYTLDNLSPGMYDVTASATGYIDNTVHVQVDSGKITNQDIFLSPEGEFTIVLTWGATPADLDSHLFILPDFHIGTSQHPVGCDEGDLSGPPFAQLDVDDTDGEGPETITIGSFLNSTYVYAVYNFSGGPPLTESSAVVKVDNGTDLIAEYFVPTLGSGRWWVVFIKDGAGEITGINTIVDIPEEFPPGAESCL
jgi:hypothetical protein